MSTEDQSPEDNLKRAQEQALKALGVVVAPPVYEMDMVVHTGAKQPAAARSDFRNAHDDNVLNDQFGRHLLALAVSNDKGDTITAADMDALGDEIEAMCKTAGVSQDEIAEIIEKLNANIGAPKSSMGAIKEAAKGMADAAVSAAAASKAEMQEQKMDRLWGEVSKLNKEIDKDFDALEPWLTAEERKLRVADRKAVEEAEKERQRVYADPNATEEERRKADQRLQQANVTQAEHQKVMVTRVERDNPNNPEVTTITAPLKTEMEKRDEKLWETGLEIGSAFMPTPTTKSVDSAPVIAQATPPALPSSNVSFSRFGGDEVSPTPAALAKEVKAAVSPTLVASFGGFGTDGEPGAQPPIALKDAKTAVSPTLVASFSGFDAPEGAPSQTPGAKPKDAPTRQA
jgi:hypothetical protein